MMAINKIIFDNINEFIENTNIMRPRTSTNINVR